MYFSLAALSTTLVALATAQTNFTGDTIGGYPVITSLDLASVPPNAITRYWLYTAMSQGMIPYYLPVFVARGSNESLETGRRLSLSASIHGDELNGIPVVQRVFRSLTSAVESGDFNGTIIGVPTMNPNGNQHNQRNFWTSNANGFYVNLNRIFPGVSIAAGGSITGAYAYSIWNNLWGNKTNVDIAVDFHTLSTGADGPLWAYADYRRAGVQRLAELAQPDVIKIDPGEPGSVETTWVVNSIPAITLEIGPAKRWNDDLIDRAEQFVYRLLADLEMTPNATRPTIDLSDTYKATNFSEVSVTRTGWVNMTVNVLDDVQKGQQVGVVYNSWGDVLQNLTAAVAGRVLQVRTDPAVEMGVSVLTLVYNATTGN